MSEPREMMAVMNHGDISVAIKMPVREDGALAFAVAEIATEVKDMFRSALESVGTFCGYGDDDDDEGTITTDA